MNALSHFTAEAAETIAEGLGVDLNQFGLEQFRLGLEIEREHGSLDPVTDITHDDPLLIGRIVLAHLKKRPDYYYRLQELETQPTSLRPELDGTEALAEYL
jgi:hypothetical protein